ncbi:MAG: HAMP domain-containing histidine kinase [Bacteroidales bacterium]|nr:HAMP domain-containing histidine kinase [Bacteroidales bacterium]MCF8389872.1 HAMP domain-containing histidine kinase [Bacteroidales bacterium]
MKLLNRTSYILITTILFVVFFGSIAFYIILKSTTDKEIKKELNSRMEYVIHEFRLNPTVFGSLSLPGYITVEEGSPETKSMPFFRDTILLDELDNSYKQYKSLTADVEVNSEFYRINVYKSLSVSNQLIERITLIVTIIIIVFILFIYLLNRFIFERVWADFFVTIDKLKSYNVDLDSSIHFEASEIAEFNLLNSALNQMIVNLREDYLNVKEFTGNISHEIQTPLSIIRLKCELLLQSMPLSNKQAELIRDIQKTNSRLSRLNKTLVLLTKIDNKQFPQKEKISVDEIIRRHLEDFTSLATLRNIELKYSKNADIYVFGDATLIDVLLVNLIKNAVLHNIDNGKIFIETKDNEIIISNTGEEKELQAKKIFDRYTKFSGKNDSLGLGLSLVKKICDLYRFKISYKYENNLHIFSLLF